MFCLGWQNEQTRRDYLAIRVWEEGDMPRNLTPRNSPMLDDLTVEVIWDSSRANGCEPDHIEFLRDEYQPVGVRAEGLERDRPPVPLTARRREPAIGEREDGGLVVTIS